jgi:hypothetical protein
LAEVAQRDLDAALQLLADRAQYITGAGGAAIALRRTGKNDLLCRASAGSNAPELGALLSTEFGLSGESVRTRRALRCDDAERDARVNREVCRELGIASVVVMPVVDDDQVLGVFELFSGRANAFGERDLSALERLSQMVETAVRMARAAETLPERLSAAEGPVQEVRGQEVAPHEVTEHEIEVQDPIVEVVAEASAPALAPGGNGEVPAAVAALATPSPSVAAHLSAQPSQAPKPAAVSRPLFWSVALSASGEGAEPDRVEEDQSHVPPMLRNLRKCEACGFPVSAGRALCVECEEKKWRGQLKRPQPAMERQLAERPASSGALAPKKPEAEPVAAVPTLAAKSAAGTGHVASAAAVQGAPKAVHSQTPAEVLKPPAELLSTKADVHPSKPSSKSGETSEPAAVPVLAPPAFVLSAGLEPSQSWFSRNKYVILVMLTAGAAVAGVLLLR